MRDSVIQRLNKIIAAFPCVMIEQKEGRVYHLFEHWTHVQPKRTAKRVLIGKGRISNNQFEYITHLIK
jgi:hypothetical protein